MSNEIERGLDRGRVDRQRRLRKGGDMARVLTDLASRSKNQNWVNLVDLAKRSWTSSRNAALERLKKRGYLKTAFIEGETLVSITPSGRTALSAMES